jgi:hypothetical protein
MYRDILKTSVFGNIVLNLEGKADFLAVFLQAGFKTGLFKNNWRGKNEKKFCCFVFYNLFFCVL